MVSKHASAEAKLHISPHLRDAKAAKLRPDKRITNQPSGPPKGTNSNNQYR